MNHRELESQLASLSACCDVLTRSLQHLSDYIYDIDKRLSLVEQELSRYKTTGIARPPTKPEAVYNIASRTQELTRKVVAYFMRNPRFTVAELQACVGGTYDAIRKILKRLHAFGILRLGRSAMGGRRQYLYEPETEDYTFRCIWRGGEPIRLERYRKGGDFGDSSHRTRLDTIEEED